MSCASESTFVRSKVKCHSWRLMCSRANDRKFIDCGSSEMASPCLLVCGVQVYGHNQLQPCCCILDPSSNICMHQVDKVSFHSNAKNSMKCTAQA